MKNIKPLAEVDSYVLFLEHENVFLFNKDLSKELWRTSMDDNPTFGLLGLINYLPVIGGEYVTIWINNERKQNKDSGLI